MAYGYAVDSTCNPAGLDLRTKTDARGLTTTYCYDALHRVTQKSFSNTTPPTPALYFSYDVAPSWMTDLTNVVGRLVYGGNQYAGSSGSIAAAFVNSYDPIGRVIRQWQQTPSTSPGGYFVYAAYDVAGQLKSLTYPSGRVVNYHFDAAARMYSVDSYLSVSAFWPTATWQSATYGNGTKQQDTYNPRLQPTELKLLNSGNGSIADRQYVWTGCAEGLSSGNNGNVCGINDMLNSGRNQTYNFDALNRIISGSESDGAFNQTMSYDVWGNPSISGPSGGNLRTYNTQNRDTAYGYDAAGNLTNDGTFTYSYDAEEQLSSFISNSTGSQVANYVYDADGNRVRKNVGSGWTEYIYFGSNIIAEKAPSGWTDYIFAGGKRIAQVSSSGTQYYWGDHLGTTKMTLDASGNSQCYAIYTPFGSEVSGCPTHYKFNAKERDFEDGLDYFGARYYSSNMGRWMSPDWAAKPTAVPYANFGNPQSLNLYNYVQNNPVTVGDPDGHCDVSCVWNVMTTLQDAANASLGVLVGQANALATDPRATSLLTTQMAMGTIIPEGAPEVESGEEIPTDINVGRASEPVVEVPSAPEPAEATESAPIAKYNRAEHYGNPATSTAAREIREANEGKPCPECGKTMTKGSPNAPTAQHTPTLKEHYYTRGRKMSATQRRAYARSAKSMSGVKCKTCESKEGAQEAGRQYPN